MRTEYRANNKYSGHNLQVWSLRGDKVEATAIGSSKLQLTAGWPHKRITQGGM